MTMRRASLLIIVVLLFTPVRVWAIARHNGFVDHEVLIHHLVDVDVKGAKGEPLFLGYKTYRQRIAGFLGLFITDDGYVLGVRGNADEYYPMTPEETKGFQEKGFLPTPLPAYSLSFSDYFSGYSFWLVVVALATGSAVNNLRKRRARAAAAEQASGVKPGENTPPKSPAVV